MTSFMRQYGLRAPNARTILILTAVLTSLYIISHVWSLQEGIKPPTSPTEQDVAVNAPAIQKPIQPPPEPSGIPKKIWYKLGPNGMDEQVREWTNTCISQNPNYEVEFLTDESADDFVRSKFSHRPDIVDTYMALNVPIFKADLLRYLLLYEEGGVYMDLDATCEGIPIDQWVPEHLKPNTSLVVGWEFDGGYHFDFDRQFVTWTVLAKKGVVHLMAVVDDVIKTARETAEANQVEVGGLRMSMVKDVIEFTGPKRFEKNIIKSVEQVWNKSDGWEEEYHELLEPKMAGDVLILPGYALAASYNSYEPEDQHRVGAPLVIHHYAGTWKNDYGGQTVEGGGDR